MLDSGPVFKIDSMSESYRAICWRVMEGHDASPRGMKTREVLDALIILSDPRQSLPYGTNRKLHPAVGAVEALQLMGGFSDPRLMCAVSPHFKPFLEGSGYHGPYGIRLRGQLKQVIERLRTNPDTRQAVVTIWDPINDLHVDGALDYPCTVMLQFLIRDHRLILHTTMRSNDAWLGLPYDVFQFTQLQLTVANILGIRVGPYHHHAVSLHLYEKTFALVDGLISGSPTTAFVPTGLHVNSYEDMVVQARYIGADPYADQGYWGEEQQSELWYLNKLNKYVKEARDVS